MVSQANGVTQRIDLPFALVDARFHGGIILFPFTFFVHILVKSVGIRIEDDAFFLAIDDASYQLLQRFVFLDQRQVWPDLSGAVAQPHGINVASDDIGVGFAINDFKFNGGIEGIGKTIFKQPGQFWISDLFF